MSIIGRIKEQISSTCRRALGIDSIGLNLRVALDKLEKLYGIEGKLAELEASSVRAEAMSARAEAMSARAEASSARAEAMSAGAEASSARAEASSAGAEKQLQNLKLFLTSTGNFSQSDPEEEHHAQISEVLAIRLLTLPVKRCEELLSDCIRDLLRDSENVLILFDNAIETQTESLIYIGPSSAQEPVRRSRLYLQMAKIACKHRLNSVIALANSKEGLLAMVSVADISGVPVALVLPEKNSFANDPSAQALLTEAVEKARLAVGLSVTTVAYVQSNLGKTLWRVSTLDDEHSNAVPGNQTGRRDSEILAWILESLEEGFPSDRWLRGIETGKRLTFTVPYIDPLPPKSLHWSMHDHFQALYRLRATGYRPEFVVDVGASTGFWSHVASLLFPKSRFYLIEPLLEQYRQLNQSIYSLHPEFVIIPSAAGDKPGEAELNVSSDLYSSSFFESTELSSDRHWDRIRVRVRTLDEISSTFSIQGRGMLKIDVQFAEHLVLDGGTQFLEQVDVICVELSIHRFVPGSKTFFEMMTKLHYLGFQYFDFAGSWRKSRTGRLVQQDAIFMRTSLTDEFEWN